MFYNTELQKIIDDYKDPEFAYAILQQLDKLNVDDKEGDFISSMIDRYNQYNERMLISDKQAKWLYDLDQKYLEK